MFSRKVVLITKCVRNISIVACMRTSNTLEPFPTEKTFLLVRKETVKDGGQAIQFTRTFYLREIFLIYIDLWLSLQLASYF